MGSKVAARELMQAAGVPSSRGRPSRSRRRRRSLRLGEELGWPLAIKASAGGGGKGLKVVALAPTRSSARSSRRAARARRTSPTRRSTSSATSRIPRHVEVQVLADAHGNVDPPRRARLHDPAPAPEARRGDAVAGGDAGAARRGSARSPSTRRAPSATVGAGTIEGLLDRDGNYYFLEMNTRIQVEHTVTELVTGIDLVREQVLVAAGEPLAFAQEDVRLRGHAIECRINAEDVSRGFLPTPGPITRYREPAGPGVRVDSGVVEGGGGPRALRPAGREARRLGRRPRARAAAHAARARGVRDRGRDDAARLPPGAARAPVLRRGRDVPRPRRVGAAGAAGGAVVSSDNERSRAARTARLRERVVAVELDGRRFEVRGARARAAVRRARAPAARARGRRGAAARRATRSSARCRAPCSPSRSRTGTSVARGPGHLRRRGDEDGERDRGSPRRQSSAALAVAAGEPVTSGQVICVVRSGRRDRPVAARPSASYARRRRRG